MSHPDHLASPCVCCKAQGVYSVLLAVGLEDDERGSVRFYLPNQHARALRGEPPDPCRTVWFCRACMRAVEDTLRETIAERQRQNGVLPDLAGDEP